MQKTGQNLQTTDSFNIPVLSELFMDEYTKVGSKKVIANIEKLISYQDTEAHLGTIYKASNWSAVNVSASNKTWGNRQRNIEQSTASKVRWQYQIK
jgi:hypothetical protein